MTITTEAALVYRDREDGARWNPKKDEIRALFASVDLASRFALDYDDASVQTVAERFKDMPVSISNFAHLVVDDDWTIASNTAALTFKNLYYPKRDGGYKITDTVNFQDCYVFGDGPVDSYFRMADDFNLSAERVIYFPSTATETQSGMGEMGLYFEQPVTAVRSELIQYPWAIDGRNTPRLKFSNIRISLCWDGFNLQGNTGGFTGQGLLEIGCFNRGMVVGNVEGATGDGVLDFFHIDALHFAPFNGANSLLSGGLLDIYSDGENQAWVSGRMDGLSIKVLDSFRGRVTFASGDGASPFGGSDGVLGSIGALQLDGSYARLVKGNGRLNIGTMYSTSSADDDFAIQHDSAGGHLQIGAAWLAGFPTATQDLVQAKGGSYIGFGPLVILNPPTGSAVLCATGLGSEISAPSMNVLAGSNAARTRAFAVAESNGILTIPDAVFPRIGTGSGNAVTLAENLAHNISGVRRNGWGLTYPTTSGATRQGVYGPQAGSATATVTPTGAPAYSITIQPGIDAYIVTGGGQISNILQGYEGQKITLITAATTTFVDGASLYLRNGINYVAAADESLTFVCRTGYWIQDDGRTALIPTDYYRDVTAADPLPVTQPDSTLFVAGNTNFGTISATYKGHVIRLVFSGTPTVINGTNIRLNGAVNFVASANDVLTLVCNGTEWLQAAPASVNT